MLAHEGAYLHGSFRAFYCAGYAANVHADVYRVEPMASCEQRVTPGLLPAGAVEPAPIPGYAIAPFRVLATLSFKDAASVYFAVVWLCIVLSAWILGDLLRVPKYAILLCMMPLALLNAAFGDLPPMVVFALCVSGWCLRAQRYALAGVAAAAAMMQPHIGMGALVALFLLVPRSRMAILCAVAVLAALSVAAIGLPENLEYFRVALPAQELSELRAADQFGLAHVLYGLGMSSRSAIAAAQIETIVMLVAGIAAGRRAAAAWNAPEALAFLPPAALLLGGLYSHDIEILAALPAALLIAVYARGAASYAAWLGLSLLSMLWTQHPGRAVMLLNGVAVISAALVALRGRTVVRVAAGAAVALLLTLTLRATFRRPPDALVDAAPVKVASAASDLGAAAWRTYIESSPARTFEGKSQIIARAAAWSGIGLVLLVALAQKKEQPTATGAS